MLIDYSQILFDYRVGGLALSLGVCPYLCCGPNGPVYSDAIHKGKYRVSAV